MDAAYPKVGAVIIPALGTHMASAAGDIRLKRHAVANLQILVVVADLNNCADSFMAQSLNWVLHRRIGAAVSGHIRAADSTQLHFDHSAFSGKRGTRQILQNKLSGFVN